MEEEAEVEMELLKYAISHKPQLQAALRSLDAKGKVDLGGRWQFLTITLIDHLFHPETVIAYCSSIPNWPKTSDQSELFSVLEEVDALTFIQKVSPFRSSIVAPQSASSSTRVGVGGFPLKGKGEDEREAGDVVGGGLAGPKGDGEAEEDDEADVGLRELQPEPEHAGDVGVAGADAEGEVAADDDVLHGLLAVVLAVAVAVAVGVRPVLDLAVAGTLAVAPGLAARAIGVVVIVGRRRQVRRRGEVGAGRGRLRHVARSLGRLRLGEVAGRPATSVIRGRRRCRHVGGTGAGVVWNPVGFARRQGEQERDQ